MNLTLNKAICNLFTSHSGSWWWIWLQTEFGCKGITSAEDPAKTIWPPHCDLDHAKHFSHDTGSQWWISIMFGYKRLYHSEDITWVKSQSHFEPLLWPWPSPWTQQTTHSMTLCDCGSWWCITVPSSVTKLSAVQKVPSGQTLNCILNHYCDLDLLHNKNAFSKSVLAYDGLPTI